MELDFNPVLDNLGPDAALRVISAQRDMSDYLMFRFLPEVVKGTFTVSAANITIRPTMAGLAAMDSEYPKGGFASAATFVEEAAKLALSVPLSEATQRELHELLAWSRDADPSAVLSEYVLRFVEDVIVQGQLDSMEYLRAQALSTGALSWTFNNIPLSVSYGVPSGNKLATRTTASGKAYNAASSTFWADMYELRKALKHRVAAFVTNSATWEAIVGNSANEIMVVGEGENYFDIARHVGNGVASAESRYRVRMWLYDLESEILDPSDPAATKVVPFWPDGVITAVGRGGRRQIFDPVGMGSPASSDTELTLDGVTAEIGYTHIGPTIEGGRPGRWARVYTPQGKPYMLVGESVTNGLPVITQPELLAIASTELS